MFCFRAKVVPENIVKKQARDAKLLKARVDARAAAKAKRAEARVGAAKRAIEYAAEYQKADEANIKAKRDAKANGDFFVDAQAKIAFVIRTRG